jgi:hypothetical protein
VPPLSVLEETSMAELLPRPVPGVIVQQQEEAWFLLDTEGGEVFNINATAASIFSLCQSGMTLDGAVQSLSARFNVSGQEADIREDVLATVRTFQELGLCEPSSP